MNQRSRARRALGLLAASVWLAAPAVAQDEAARSTMRDILVSLVLILPDSLDDERFGDPARREALAAALGQLERDGARLESHGETRDVGFGFLSRSLARDTREIRQRYQEGRYAEARFLLHELTENCIACHSRLPDDREHPLGNRLFEIPELAELEVEERLRLELATRQWDAALASYEALFADPRTSPADLDLTGHLDGYLEVCLRVKADPARARRALEVLRARDDVARPLAANLDQWTKSLKGLESRPPTAASLKTARDLIVRSEDRERYPDERRALVVYIAASGTLHRFVSQADRRPEQLGEAYYLLGLVESHVGRSFWLSQTEHYLEAAIRAAPGEPSAQKAYTLLEEFVISGYTGSGGREVPPEVQARLDSLKQLIEAGAAT